MPPNRHVVRVVEAVQTRCNSVSTQCFVELANSLPETGKGAVSQRSHHDNCKLQDTGRHRCLDRARNSRGERPLRFDLLSLTQACVATFGLPIEVISLCTPSPFTPLGIKGVGEGGAIAPGACLANAVSDALAPLGVSVAATPLTPEAVLRLIHAAAG